MNSISRILSMMTICCFVAAANKSQETGKIIGIVLDENGSAVVGAKVSAESAGHRKNRSFVRYFDTDATGRFIIDRLIFDAYNIFAKKEEQAYPDTRWSFYSGDVFARATVSPAHPTADVRIKIGPKAGLLTGSVSDASSGAAVPAAFKLTRVESPNDWISASMPPSYRVLLPAGTLVNIEVSAPGFKTWTYPQALRLQSGVERRIDIPLEPSHDPSLQPARFLVPDGYVGWLLLEYKVAIAKPIPVESGEAIFKFPTNGLLSTSSDGPQRGAQDIYLFYARDGSIWPIPVDYRKGNSMIWGQYEGTRNGVLSQFGFFVGTEEQYRKYQSLATHPGPIPGLAR